MPTLTKMIVDYRKPTEIAEWLYNGENTLDELTAFDNFAPKAAAVDVAVWKMCQKNGNHKRYLEIYEKKGNHSQEVIEAIQKEDDDAWDKACKSGTCDDFEKYLKEFGLTGRHKEEAQFKKDKLELEDEAAWQEACILNTYDAYEKYREKFKKHAAEADTKMEKIKIDQAKLKEADEAEWKEACTLNTYADYDNYRKKFYYRGLYDGEAKSKMEDILRREEAARRSAEARQAEDDLWNLACSQNTIASYQSYLDTYGLSGRYGVEADNRKKQLENEQRAKLEREREEQKRKIIEDLAKNANAHPFDNFSKWGITPDDLRGKIKDSKGIVHDEVLNSWNKTRLQLVLGDTPKSIEEKCTEIYFWGDPGSGKTCAMAAILSCVNQLGYFKPRSGPGAKYMSQLAGAFGSTQDAPAVFLPQGTSQEVTQYMPLTLNAKEMHDLAIIELSGEVFKCFKVAMTDGEEYFETAEKDTDKAKLAKTYKQVKRYLESKNPKYHFFVLDSQSDDAGQADSLNWAAAYFDENKLFNDTTLGISLIVTKCDRLSPDKKQWQACANKCAEKRAPALVKSLKQILGPKGLKLTDGRIEIIPLSIGEVFFQKLCLFDAEPAEGLVNTLLQYAKVGEDIVKTKGWKKIVNN